MVLEQKIINDFQMINSVILSITNNCNLSCQYCFVHQDQHNISLDLCLRLIDLLNVNNENKYVCFFGGEPLLLFNQIIVPTIEYSKNSNIHFSITTNGTLLNEKYCEFLKNNNIDILLSMDGDQLTQDINRPTKNYTSSFQLIKSNIPIILTYYPNIEVRATIFPITAQYLFKNYKFFLSQGFQSCFFCPDEFSNWDIKQEIQLNTELKKITDIYLQYFSQNKIPPLLFIPYEKMIISLLYHKIQKNKKIKLCGSGEKTIAINYKGDIFGCQEFTSLDKDTNFSYIGNLINGIDNNKFNQLQNSLNNISIKCEDINYCNNECKYQNYCQQQICYANSYLKFQNINKKSLIICKWQNLLYTQCLILIASLNQNPLFLSHYLHSKENR